MGRMDSGSIVRRTCAALLVAAFAAGCTSGGGVSSPSPSVPTTQRASLAPTIAPTVVAADPSASALPVGLTEARNVAYESTSTRIDPGTLDVVAPAAGGPYPVVVMLHGTPYATTREYLTDRAIRVAQEGFVVFNVSWGQNPDPWVDQDASGYSVAANAQVACALAFAAARAADYGGDGSKLILFGHSGGSNAGSVVAFGEVQPASGCLAAGTTPSVDVFVVQEGDFLLSPEFDGLIAADPGFMALLTPWSVLARRPELPVVMLLSETPGAHLQAPMTPAYQATYLALRDPDGTLKRLIDATGVFDDAMLSVADEQQVLYTALKEQGNPVTLDMLPGSTHMTLSDAGWEVFLAAFDRAKVALSGD